MLVFQRLRAQSGFSISLFTVTTVHLCVAFYLVELKRHALSWAQAGFVITASLLAVASARNFYATVYPNPLQGESAVMTVRRPKMRLSGPERLLMKLDVEQKESAFPG